jgi:hypothetical protein
LVGYVVWAAAWEERTMSRVAKTQSGRNIMRSGDFHKSVTATCCTRARGYSSHLARRGVVLKAGSSPKGSTLESAYGKAQEEETLQ